MKSVHSARRGTYVVTYDVASRLRSFRPELKVPNQNDPFFGGFHKGLLERLQRALPDVTIHTIGMSKVRRKIWKEVGRLITDVSSQVVLSTCQEIADSNPKSEELCLQINRLFNTEGDMIGHGPRPGFEPLDTQFQKLSHEIAGRSVVLIEDGAFTGSTLRFVLDKLSGLGIKVTAVVIGFCCTRALAVLKEVFDGELVIVDPLDNLIDWIPDHDLIPFIPNCGRVLGEQLSEGFMPVRTASGLSCAYPYILPLGKMEKWATMPSDGARDVSKFCLETSIEIFNRIEALNGKKVSIGELLKACPRVSLPVQIGSERAFPALESTIKDFLKATLERIG